MKRVAQYLGLKKMGNGASHAGSTMTIDGEQMETSRLKMLYPELRSDLKKKDEIISEKNKKISSCELEISNLKKEIRQLQSVLEATGAVSNDIIPEEGAAGEDSSSSPKNKFLQVASKVRNKRFAISAESGKNSHAEIKLDKIPKKPEVREMIKRAILNNNFLKHLEEPQVVEMILCMSLKTYTKNECVVTEGEPGNALFVINKGSVEVQQGDKKLGKPLGPGVLFGELAILYNCTRTATVRTLEDVEVWTMERRLFQLVMKNTGTMRRDADMNFLRCVPVFQDFDADKLYKIVQIAGEDFFYENEYIIREGERGDAFYIIKEGTVKVLQMIEGKDEPQEIRKLKAGDYFGEKALLSEDVRTASIVAEKEGAKCLVIERENIMSFIGDIKDIRDKDYGDKARNAVTVKRKLSLPKSRVRSEYQMKELVDFKTIATLGLGGFGRVELVQDKADTTKTYALKYLGKKHIVETKQQEHVFNEKNILISMDSPFIVQLYKTFRDTRYVYLLMEVCLGGELWTILRDKDHFDEMTTRFYTSCVIEALDYLHQRGIVYRDLKPENLLLDAAGYVKLVDFGFAKKISSGTKTWTFCGTPEYVAPEIILNKGHDCSADYWSLGILIYELMTGNPPFTSSDSMTTYNIILRGIDALDFSSKVTKNAQQLIKRLCRENPQERLGNLKDGIMEIRKNKWFQGFHWAGVQSRALTPPFKPKIRSPTDSSNFDHYKSSKEHAPEEKSGWDKDF